MVNERRLFSVLVHNHWKGLGRYSTVGLELALSVLIGLFGGQWLDEKLGTGGWLTFLGLTLGLVAGFRSLWQQLQRANRDAERQEREERERRENYHDDPS